MVDVRLVRSTAGMTSSILAEADEAVNLSFLMEDATSISEFNINMKCIFLHLFRIKK